MLLLVPSSNVDKDYSEKMAANKQLNMGCIFYLSYEGALKQERLLLGQTQSYITLCCTKKEDTT